LFVISKCISIFFEENCRVGNETGRDYKRDMNGRIKVGLAVAQNRIGPEYQGEWVQVQDAVAERQREYLWGRALLRLLAARLGVELGEIGRDCNNAPLLPETLTASIRHNCG